MIISPEQSMDQLVERVSLAVRLFDDYSLSRDLVGQVKVFIKDRYSAVRNISGYYVFTDLKSGPYEITVEADCYFSETKPVTVTPVNLPVIIDINLKPNPRYPFPANATLARVLLKDDHGDYLKNAKIRIQALYLDNPAILRETIVKARLQRKGSPRELDIYIDNVMGSIAETGKIRFITPIGREDPYDVSSITVNHEIIALHLGQALNKEYPLGSPLYQPADYETNTDNNGESAAYFRPLVTKAFRIKINVNGFEWVKNAMEGKTTVLGVLTPEI